MQSFLDLTDQRSDWKEKTPLAYYDEGMIMAAAAAASLGLSADGPAFGERGNHGEHVVHDRARTIRHVKVSVLRDELREDVAEAFGAPPAD